MMLQRCCCFSLRTGTLAIGWYGIVSSTLGLIFTIYAFCKQSNIIARIEENIPKDQHVDEETIEMWVEIFLSVVLILCVVGIILSALLIVGTKRRRSALLLPWIIAGVINIALGSAYSTQQVLKAFSQDAGSGFLSLFIVVISYGINIYLWCVVYSFYKELRREMRGEHTALITDSTRSNDGLPAYMRIA